MVVEDRHSTPADLASFRIDFREFLRSLSRRNRRIALELCKGETTQGVARRFRISMGRVSQLRREFCKAWREFHGVEVLASPA
jgi:FixJ family two-component response regulator